MSTRTWHENFLQALEELADTELQRRAWVDREVSTLPDPAELVCQVFDDSGLDVLLAGGEVFSKVADALLADMSARAGELKVDRPPALLLAVPAGAS